MLKLVADTHHLGSDSTVESGFFHEEITECLESDGDDGLCHLSLFEEKQ